MARKQITASQQQLLERTLSDLATWIQGVAPQSRVEITLEQYEDEDVDLYVHPSPIMTEDDIERRELMVGERCNEILLDMGLFVVSAVCG
jgi:hypothetical protein